MVSPEPSLEASWLEKTSWSSSTTESETRSDDSTHMSFLTTRSILSKKTRTSTFWPLFCWITVALQWDRRRVLQGLYVQTRNSRRLLNTWWVLIKTICDTRSVILRFIRLVRYAGEFHIQENNGKYKLVIDNNSGTYSPNKDLLPHLANVCPYNHPIHPSTDEQLSLIGGELKLPRVGGRSVGLFGPQTQSLPTSDRRAQECHSSKAWK